MKVKQEKKFKYTQKERKIFIFIGNYLEAINKKNKKGNTVLKEIVFNILWNY